MAYTQAQSLDIEIDKEGLKEPLPLREVLRKVAAYYGVSEKELEVAKRGRGQQNIPRWIAMKLCQDVGGAKLVEISDLFQVGHYSTISQTIARLNKLLSKDEMVKKDFNKLSQNLTR